MVSKTFMRLSCFVLQHKSHIQSNLSLCLLKPKSCYVKTTMVALLINHHVIYVVEQNKKVSSGNSHHSLLYFTHNKLMISKMQVLPGFKSSIRWTATFYTLKNKGSLMASMVIWRTLNIHQPFKCRKGSL